MCVHVSQHMSCFFVFDYWLKQCWTLPPPVTAPNMICTLMMISSSSTAAAVSVGHVIPCFHWCPLVTSISLLQATSQPGHTTSMSLDKQRWTGVSCDQRLTCFNNNLSQHWCCQWKVNLILQSFKAEQEKSLTWSDAKLLCDLNEIK